ncbi:hypothetical protein F4779DRAFT_611349 [Xylariaceae sp. FL0662B]|nr:hypothetical protein F4779DRAFT_611349 [Xylariaceae sp. FL0662B]
MPKTFQPEYLLTWSSVTWVSGSFSSSIITTVEDLKHFRSGADNHPKVHSLNLGWFVGKLLDQTLGRM